MVHNLSLFLVLSLPPFHLPGVHLAGEMELFFPLFDFLVTGKLSFPLPLPLSLVVSHTHTHTRLDPCFAGPLNISAQTSCGRTRTQHRDTLEKITSPFQPTMVLGSRVILSSSVFSLSSMHI